MATRSIGVLTIDLIARTGSFVQGMTQAERQARKSATEIDKITKSVDKAMMAFAAAGVAFVASAAAMATSAARAIDSVAKMSTQIGVTTEALSGLHFAVKQFVNVNDQQLDNSLRRMTRRIASAAEGSGAAKQALDELGLSAKELARMSADRQFLAISDAMKRTEGQATRLKHAFDIFGREGQTLVGALQQGREELEKNIDRARVFGVVVSQDAAAAAETFATNLGLLSSASEGFKTQLTEAMLPAMVRVTDKLVEMSESAGSMADKVAAALRVVTVAATGVASIFAGRFIASILATVTAWAKATAAAAAYQMQMASLSSAIAGSSRVMAAGASAAAGAAAVMSNAMRVALGVMGGPVGLIASIALAGGAFIAMGRDAKTAAGDVDVLSAALDGLTERQLVAAQLELTQKIQDAAEEMVQAQYELDRLTIFLAEAEKGSWATAQELDNLRKEIIEAGARVDTAGQKFDQLALRSDQITAALARLRDGLSVTIAGVNELAGALTETNEAGAAYLERMGRMALLAGATTELEKLNRQIEAGVLVFADGGEEARKLAAMVDAAAKSFSRAGGSVRDWRAEVKRLLDTLLPQNKALRDYQTNLGLLDRAHKAGTLSTTEYQKSVTLLNDQYKKQAEQWLPESLKKIKERVRAEEDHFKSLTRQVQVFGMTEKAVAELEAAETRAAIAKLEGVKATELAAGASEERIQYIEAEIEALRRLLELQEKSIGERGKLDFLNRQKEQWSQWAREVEQIFDQVGQSLTDAIFEGGRKGKDLLQSMFKALTFRVFIQPVMGSLQGTFTSVLGSAFGIGGAGGAGSLSTAMGLGNIASGLSSAWSALTGGMTSTLASGIAWMGEAMGSQALASFAAGMKGATLAPGLMGPTTAGASGAMGMGAAAGAAMQWIAGIGAGFGLGSLISGNLSVGGSPMIAPAVGTAGGALIGGPIGAAIGGILGGVVNRLFGRGPKEYTNDYLDLVFSDAGLEASIEHRWRQKGGALRSGREGSDWEGLGPGDAMYDELAGIFDAGAQRAMAAARMLGFDASLAGFGFAPGLVHLNQDDQELMQQQLQERILATLNEAAVHLTDGGALWGIEKEGELYIDMMMRIADALATVNPMLDLLGLNLIEVSGYGGHMASQLLELMGGAEAAMQSMEFYYQNFYSEQERIAKTTEQLTDVFAQFGLTLPRSHAEFRQLVEALDLTTDRGNVLFATLMNIAPAFDQIARYAQGAAGVMMDGFQRVEALANRLSKTLQAIQIGGALTDRLAGLLGRSPVFGQRREAELWAAMGGATPEQQIEMAGQLTDLVLARYQLEQDAQRKQADSIREQLTSITRMRDLAKGLQDYLRSLESSSLAPYSLAEKIGIAEVDLQRLVSAAQAGDEHAMSQVQGALQNALQLWRDYGASGAEYQAAYERLTGMAGGLADSVYSVSERQARSLERQVDQLDQANGYSQAQLAELAQIYDIAMAATLALEEQYALDAQALAEELTELERIGLDTARLHDIADLMQGLPAQIGALINSSLSATGQAALQEVTSGPIGGSTVIGGIAGIVAGGLTGNTKGETYFLNNPDVATAYAVDSQGMSVEDFARWHYQTYGQYEGRSYAVGTSRVPHDMLANIHKDEMVIDARSSDVLRRYGISIGDGQVVREIRELRSEVVELREQNARIGARLVDATRQTSGDIETAITRRERDDLVVTKSRRHGVLA